MYYIFIYNNGTKNKNRNNQTKKKLTEQYHDVNMLNSNISQKTLNKYETYGQDSIAGEYNKT